MDNFTRAAKALRGEALTNNAPPPYPFNDVRIRIKSLRAPLMRSRWRQTQSSMSALDALITKIASAQEPDGYLYTARTINPKKPHNWSGKERWLRDPDQSHELYNAGHLFEAAAAHYEATGKTNLLNVAIKEADLLCNTFGPDKLHIWPGHEIVENTVYIVPFPNTSPVTDAAPASSRPPSSRVFWRQACLSRRRLHLLPASPRQPLPD